MTPRARRLTAGLALACSVVLGTAGCSSLRGTDDGVTYIQGGGAVSEYAPDEREDPVVLRDQPTTTGGTVSIEPGTVTVVNVWWSGCGPCRTEMPLLTEADRELGDSVDFVGINIRDTSASQAATFERARGVDYPSIYAPDGRALLAFSGSVAPQTMPSTAVLDTEGRVAAVISGEIPSKQTLLDVVETVVEEG